MDYPKIKEVIEVRSGDDLTNLNQKLSEGWLLIGIRKYREAKPDKEFNEYVIYILGLPSE